MTCETCGADVPLTRRAGGHASVCPDCIRRFGLTPDEGSD